jgi:riboflavin biosynthesis pyrimidine reductase
MQLFHSPKILGKGRSICSLPGLAYAPESLKFSYIMRVRSLSLQN